MPDVICLYYFANMYIYIYIYHIFSLIKMSSFFIETYLRTNYMVLHGTMFKIENLDSQSDIANACY